MLKSSYRKIIWPNPSQIFRDSANLVGKSARLGALCDYENEHPTGTF